MTSFNTFNFNILSKLFLSIILLLSFSLAVTSQTYYFMQGAGSLQGGTASSDIWSANNNQAGLAFTKADICAGFHYQNQFLIKELGLSSGALSFKTEAGTFGLSLSSFGYTNFNTKKITLGFGKMLGKRFSAGVGLNYINLYQAGTYGSTNIFSFDIGLLAKASDKIMIGAHVFNPIRAEIGDYYGEKMPVIFNIGLQWKQYENLKILADLMTDEVNQVKFSTSAEYKIMDIFFVRLGVITNNPLMLSFGAGMHLGDFHIDFSNTMHQVLGNSPGFTVSYDFIK